jgi:hypothetical protein
VTNPLITWRWWRQGQETSEVQREREVAEWRAELRAELDLVKSERERAARLAESMRAETDHARVVVQAAERRAAERCSEAQLREEAPAAEMLRIR